MMVIKRCSLKGTASLVCISRTVQVQPADAFHFVAPSTISGTPFGWCALVRKRIRTTNTHWTVGMVGGKWGKRGSAELTRISLQSLIAIVAAATIGCPETLRRPIVHPCTVSATIVRILPEINSVLSRLMMGSRGTIREFCTHKICQ